MIHCTPAKEQHSVLLEIIRSLTDIIHSFLPSHISLQLVMASIHDNITMILMIYQREKKFPDIIYRLSLEYFFNVSL